WKPVQKKRSTDVEQEVAMPFCGIWAAFHRRPSCKGTGNHRWSARHGERSLWRQRSGRASRGKGGGSGRHQTGGDGFGWLLSFCEPPPRKLHHNRFGQRLRHSKARSSVGSRSFANRGL